MAAFVSVLTILLSAVSAVKDDCLRSPEAVTSPLEVAFLVDRSVNSAKGPFTLYQNETIRYFMSEVSQRFKGSKFAVVGYGNYPDQASISSQVSDLCYTSLVSLTQEQSTILTAVNNLKPQTVKVPTFSATYFSVMNTALNTKLGWSVDKTKVIMYFTIWSSIDRLKNPGKRNVSKMDGTDTCAETLPPDIYGMEAGLVGKGILVVGVYFIWGSAATYSKYDDEFSRIYVPYISYVIPSENKNPTAAFLTKFDYKKFATTIVEGISSELQICVFSDPPGYNTLGL